jgi:hypothetical protein
MIYLKYLLFISFIICSCSGNTYEKEPYSERMTLELLESGLDINDPLPEKTLNLYNKVKSIYIIHRPNQNTAFPIIDYRSTDAMRHAVIIKNKSEIISILNKLRSMDEKSRQIGSGTIHIIIEFDGSINKGAYFIVYLKNSIIAPIFKYDSYGGLDGGLAEWLTNNYPAILRNE